MKRRQFFKTAAGTGFLACSNLLPFLQDSYALGGKANLSKVEARYYKKHPDREIECTLCPR